MYPKPTILPSNSSALYPTQIPVTTVCGSNLSPPEITAVSRTQAIGARILYTHGILGIVHTTTPGIILDGAEATGCCRTDGVPVLTGASDLDGTGDTDGYHHGAYGILSTTPMDTTILTATMLGTDGATLTAITVMADTTAGRALSDTDTSARQRAPTLKETLQPKAAQLPLPVAEPSVAAV